MSNRETRSLVRLAASASAARTLNLVAAYSRYGQTEAYRDAPVFRSQALNRSIIVKHRLRPHELDAFKHPRPSATKVIIPFEVTDLKLGARSFFIGQKGYEQFFAELQVNEEDLAYDRPILEILDRLPSLDPFLMREKLKACGYAPARCYFDLTQTDAHAVFDMVRAELRPLIGLSFDDLEAQLDERTSRLAEKILENAAASELEPLRAGLDMTAQAFSEGLFCWKGFIYYKWRLKGLMTQVDPVSDEIGRITTSEPMSLDQRMSIDAARERLAKSIVQACRTVRQTLALYDDAFRDLTVNGNPVAFREFLLKAPRMFDELGERLGAVDHIVSFWRYRFPPDAPPKIGVEELGDLFVDFENSLSFNRGRRLAA